MNQFWYTVAGRRFVEGTMPKIERNLDRIATALETMAKAKQEAIRNFEDTILEYPHCAWCDHRHFPTSICLVDDCDCTAGGQR